MYSTRLNVYTRASLTDILASKNARVGQVGGQVGEDCRACPPDTPTSRAEVGEDVRVGGRCLYVGPIGGVNSDGSKSAKIINR